VKQGLSWETNQLCSSGHKVLHEILSKASQGEASIVRDRRGGVNNAWLVTENGDCGWYDTPEGATGPEKADAPRGRGYPAPFAAKLFTALVPAALIAKWQGVIH